MYTYELKEDDYPGSFEDLYGESPFHIGYSNRSRYILGTKPLSRDEMESIEEQEDTYFSLPVYAYVHSGSTISLSPFSCPWDSGRSGIIYARKDDLVESLGPNWESLVNQAAQYVVEAFDMYLGGDVYTVLVHDADGEIVESCGGFLGTEAAKEWAQETIAYLNRIDDNEYLQV